VQLDVSRESSHSAVCARLPAFGRIMTSEKQLTILVIEDDASDAFLLRRALA